MATLPKDLVAAAMDKATKAIEEHKERGGDDEFTNAVGLGAALEAFKESEVVKQWIWEIKDFAARPESEFEYRRQQFETVVDLYQEQPHLLDPHLQELVELLVDLVRGSESGGEEAVRVRNYAAAFATRIIKVEFRYSL